MNSTKKPVNKTKAKTELNIHLYRELKSLPARYGYNSIKEFITALAKAEGTNIPPAKRPKATRTYKT
jgi:hypothetical protein